MNKLLTKEDYISIKQALDNLEQLLEPYANISEELKEVNSILEIWLKSSQEQNKTETYKKINLVINIVLNYNMLYFRNQLNEAIIKRQTNEINTKRETKRD